MTGADLSRIARLPDTEGMRSGVVIQRGHLIDYGAPIEQGIRLAGARVVAVEKATDLAAAMDDTVAAALYVVSHHCQQRGQISLADFVHACAERKVPLIVDAAAEYDLTGFLAAGADLVIYSAHKFLGGLTAGIVAGRKQLVRAAYLQNRGIGRGMKVGKEGILGAVAALEAWSRRDRAAVRREEEQRVASWRERLQDTPGLRIELSPDLTGNPITRLRIHIDPAAGITAWELADALAEGDRPVMVRDDEIEHGYFELDPCNLCAGETEEVGERILTALEGMLGTQRASTSFQQWQAKRLARAMAWPG
jgi:L-seryl-tRNA(Ser) seleniumtransferase